MIQNEYLLVTRIGPKSLFRTWLSKKSERKFDVLLSAYDTNVTAINEDGVIFEYRPGKKIEGYNEIIKEHHALFDKYKFICFFDEDLDTTGANINNLFNTCKEFNLKIAQPALTLNSYFTYAGLLQQRGLKLRHVNYIEMMCPVFRKDILDKIAPLFNMKKESGIDLIWCNAVFKSERDFAVIDSCPIYHTEPVGKNKAANGFINGKTYESDIYSVLNDYNLPWLPCVPYSVMTTQKTLYKSRLAAIIFSLQLIISIPLKSGLKSRTRSVLTHFYHLLCKSPKNIPTNL